MRASVQACLFFVARAQLKFNNELVSNALGTVMVLNGDDFELPARQNDDDWFASTDPIYLDMRYINLVEPDWFVARGQGGHHDWPNLDTYDSWLLTPGSKPRRIIDDTSVSQSLWARKVNGKYYGVGGESVDEDDIEYRGAEDEVRDGLRVLEADRLEEIKDGFIATGTPVPDQLEPLVKSIDVDGTGEIQYMEFLAAMLDRQEYSREETLWEAFQVTC